jgi:Tol biopolymer transport system component
VAWAPGGSLIAFTQYDGYNQKDIWRVAAPSFRGTGPVNLAQHPARDCCADWSPDGQWLLFLSNRSPDGTGLQVPRPARLLAHAGQDGMPETASGLVRAMTTVVPEATEEICLVRPDGSQLTRLTDGTGRSRHATWSPAGTDGRGRMVFVSDLDGADDIYVIAVQDGVAGTVTPLTDSPEDEGWPIWSPDGACLALQRHPDSAVELYAVNAGGSGLNKLAENLSWGGGMSWTP